MSKLEKFGLFLVLLGLSLFPSPELRGLDLLFSLIGFGMFMFGDEAHLTPDAADGATGSTKNDLFDIEWVDDKTIRLKPHR